MTSRMITAVTLVALLGVAVTGYCQGDQASLIAKRDKKLASEFLKKSAWITDFDKAKEQAAKTKKPIFGYFTRSYSP